jgi:plasmid stabilization system protein ParE
VSKPIRLSRAAREEVLEAARWYGDREPELRADFLTAVDEAIDRVARYAHHLGPAPSSDPSLGVKRVFMKRFPYAVYFVELPTRIRVLAFAHARRKPFYWRERL